jgi:hypothetical protein
MLFLKPGREGSGYYRCGRLDKNASPGKEKNTGGITYQSFTRKNIIGIFIELFILMYRINYPGPSGK